MSGRAGLPRSLVLVDVAEVPVLEMSSFFCGVPCSERRRLEGDSSTSLSKRSRFGLDGLDFCAETLPDNISRARWYSLYFDAFNPISTCAHICNKHCPYQCLDSP